ncbi:MAG: lysylphosphatidylglycerol synthase transmembrane domain-containing protein, partial [Acidimicrobiia bacterium]
MFDDHAEARDVVSHPRPDARQESRRPKKSRARRITVALGSIALGVGLIVGVLPNLADFSEVWQAIRSMDRFQVTTLLLAAAWNIFTYGLVVVAVLPGLSLFQALVASQVSTAISNTLPAGSAVGIGVTYAIFSSWGHRASSIARAAIASGLWNILVKLALPAIALAILTMQGDWDPAMVTASLLGVAVLVVVIGLLVAALSSERLAHKTGDAVGHLVSIFRRPFRREPIRTWGDGLSSFRRESAALLRSRWHWVTLAAVVSHLSLFLLLLLALRYVGVTSEMVGAAEALGAFALVRLVTVLPITPGGLGVVEVGLTAGLVVAGGPEPLVVAAVIVYRALTYFLQIPLGAAAYVVWRRNRSWRDAQPSAV